MKQPLIAIAIVGAIVLAVWICLDAAYQKRLPLAASGQAYALELAIAAYKADHDGALPEGKSNAEVVALLRAPDDPNIDYLIVTGLEHEVMIVLEEDPPESAVFHAIDVWQNRFHFVLTGDGAMRAVSSGPNGIFGDGDDIFSDEARAREVAEGRRPKSGPKSGTGAGDWAPAEES